MKKILYINPILWENLIEHSTETEKHFATWSNLGWSVHTKPPPPIPWYQRIGLTQRVYLSSASEAIPGYLQIVHEPSLPPQARIDQRHHLEFTIRHISELTSILVLH